MKKLLTILICLFMSLYIMAQPRAIGLRIGSIYELSYQHSVGSDFVEVDLGLWTSRTLQATVVYDFIFASPNWTEGTWNWYAGPGIGLGLTNEFMYLGIAGQVGLEYEFASIPLVLSADVKPMLSLGVHGAGFYPGSLVNICLGVKYSF